LGLGSVAAAAGAANNKAMMSARFMAAIVPDRG
jgi:hypothetical protein